ncbi:uncharacterized protein EV154DRAFT_65612 [Mucor mucedo]|uniref:uncharacterized protein n=1 Tax=Mucor mucedo TaxID=29922 RepID=UPI00221EE2B0|nr:uncharacterized protein EV154DRAFT_65612 [Mucor mucedo]KAI7876466.1 hypothetical protein EV154DRAFT_65612 [Mucor mucedo]
MAEIQLHLNQNPTQYENVIRTQQKKYIKVFLFMYLGYLNELVSKKLLECSGYIGSQKIGYLLSMEKRLMNDIVGTKKNLRELLLASSFIQKNNDSKKVQIITQGEEVLPLLLHRLSLDLPLKSYFVLSQLHATYLQLTLKQVVKIASDEEDVAAITIQDKIIRIENIYDILPKNVWKYMIANKEIMNNCPSHNKRFLSLENYREFKIRINSFVFKRFSSFSSIGSNLDEAEIIPVNSCCSCTIILSINAIFEVAFKPIIEDVASVISSALADELIFGKYIVKTQFILGDFFSIYGNPSLRQKIESALQTASDTGTEKKELGTINFVLLQPTNYHLKPELGYPHFLHDIFHKGCLHQVSHENYGLDFYFTRKEKECQVAYKDGPMENMIECDQIAVILQRGQHITNEGITATYVVHFKSPNFGRRIDFRKSTYPLVILDYF